MRPRFGEKTRLSIRREEPLEARKEKFMLIRQRDTSRVCRPSCIP